jgi:hypothetical protein
MFSSLLFIQWDSFFRFFILHSSGASLCCSSARFAAAKCIRFFDGTDLFAVVHGFQSFIDQSRHLDDPYAGCL